MTLADVSGLPLTSHSHIPRAEEHLHVSHVGVPLEALLALVLCIALSMPKVVGTRDMEIYGISLVPTTLGMEILASLLATTLGTALAIALVPIPLGMEILAWPESAAQL